MFNVGDILTCKNSFIPNSGDVQFLEGYEYVILDIKYHDNINLKQREIDAYYDYVLNLNPSLWRKYKSILSIALLEKYNHLDSASNFNMI